MIVDAHLALEAKLYLANGKQFRFEKREEGI